MAERFAVPVNEVERIGEPTAIERLRSLEPDVVFVIGWSEILAPEALATARSTEWAYRRTFVPDTRIDISSAVERKLEPMRCYSSEIRDYPHPCFPRALEYGARTWGNRVWVDAAEPFMTVRRVVRGG